MLDSSSLETVTAVLLKGLEVRVQGQGLKARKGHQCLECKFTTHKYVSVIWTQLHTQIHINQ